MSYSISVTDMIVHINFHGDVDGLDVIQLIKDPQFLPNLHKLQRVIYNFSSAQSVQLEIDDLFQFVLLGKVQAVFTENIHGVIVLHNASGRSNAELYSKGLVNTQWKINVVDTVKEAMKTITSINH